MSDSRRATALVIPAFNEAVSIAGVVTAMSQYGQPIVVDDGSSDGTGAVAREAGAIVLTHACNRGYDRALESGLNRAVRDGFVQVVTLDADGQHHPDVIASVLGQMALGVDMVVGVRDKHQRFSERVFASAARWLWGIEDPLCGVKVYRVDLLRAIGTLSTYSSIGTELAVRGARSGWRIAQVPIRTTRRDGASRFGMGFGPNMRILNALILGLVLARPHRHV